MANDNPFIPAPATPGGQVVQQDLDRAILENAAQEPLPVEQAPIEQPLPVEQAPIQPEEIIEAPVEQEALTPIEQKIQTAEIPTDEEIADEAAPIRKQIAATEAAANVEEEAINKAFDRKERAFKELEQAYASAKEIDPKRYFKNQSTGDKIQSAIGLFLMGFGGSGEAGLKMVQKQIDADIQSQKLGKEDVIKKTAVGLKLAENELDRLSALTRNKERKIKLDVMKGKLQSAQQVQLQKLVQAQSLASPTGFTTQELYTLPENQVKKAVRFPDGKFRIATSAVLAKKLNEEVIPSGLSALNSIKQLKDIGAESAGGSMSLESRRKAQTLVQSLVGNLRLELFGPGVLTDAEQKIAREIIGNPTKVLGLSSLELASLGVLEDKLKYSIRTRVKQAVPSTPDSKNEKKIKILMSKNPGLSKSKAMNALIKIGKWDSEESF